MAVRHLDPTGPTDASTRYGGEDHPMRRVTRQVAFDDAWDRERLGKVRDLFDGLAVDWTAERGDPARLAPLHDALERGEVDDGTVVELGAGTGLASASLLARFSTVVSMDLSFEMLRRGTAVRPVCADAARLPLPDHRADVLVLMNMLLFPAEVDRVLAPAGTLVWVNSRAGDTPIHLPADDVDAALPGTWTGVASLAGQGSWCVLRRTGSHR